MIDERISNLEQVNYIRRYTLDNGLKVIELYNGVLRVLLNESRALDIMQIFYKGMNTSYMSKDGFLNDTSLPFVERYEAGAMYTCGLDGVGATKYAQFHGTIHFHQAFIEETKYDDKNIIVKGYVRSSALFGHNLVLKRTIRLNYNDPKLYLDDELINEGYKEENYAILYHFNVGYPMIDDKAMINGNFKRVKSASKYAEDNISIYNKITAPIPYQEEMCYMIDNNSNNVELLNSKINTKMRIEYSKDTLPKFLLWKSMASRDYVLGLEPTTTYLNDNFEYSKIQANEHIKFEICVIFETF